MMKKVKIKKKRNQKKLKKNLKLTGIITFPAKLLAPVSNFLRDRLQILEKRKKEIDEEDPFKDTARLMDNASPDTDAAEQFGHAKISAIKEQLDRRIIQTRKALTRVKIGKYGICEDCGKMIDTDRLMAYPEATLCLEDQQRREK